MGRAPASDHQVHGGDVCETPQRKCGHLSVNELFLFFSHFLREQKKKWEENIRWRERKVFSLSDGGTDTYASDRTINTGNHLEPTKKCSEGSNFYFSSQRPLFWTEYAFNWLIKLPESNKSFKCLSSFNPSTFKWAKFQKISKNFKKFQKIFK